MAAFIKQMYKKGMTGINKLVGGIVSLIVLLLVASVLIPEGQTAGQTLNASGVPLGSLFGSNGVLFVIIMAALFIGVYKYWFKGSGK